MKLDNWESSKDLNGIYADIRRLGLEQCVAEHDAFGFTVVPPENLAPPETNRRLLDAILRVHKERTGHTLTPADLANGSLEGDRPMAIHLALLGEDRIFEEVLMNPVVYALARYFCGKSVLLSDTVALIKRRDETPTHRLHIDQSNTPPPLPVYPQMLNITWTLTDYTLESGPLAVVPGSHRYGRPPMLHEENFLREDAPIKPAPVLCPAGSLVAFGGTTWHAAYPRTAPGLRVTFVMTFCRAYMKPMRDFRTGMSKEILARNPPEFADLIGMDALFPMDPRKEASPDTFEKHRAAGRNMWG